MLKKLPAVLVGLVLTIAAYAATVELTDNHPDTYTVRKGDTLWSISARFLKQPWLWPEVWQANGQIRNPHLIYPGDVINLAYLNGQPRLSVSETSSNRTSTFGPHVRAESLEHAVEPLPLEEIQDFLKRTRLLGEDEFAHAPHVLAFEDNHLRGGPGQLAYIRGVDAQPGQIFAVVRPIGRYYDYVSHDPNEPTGIFRQSLEDRDDRPSMLWHSGPENFTLRGDVHFLGYEVLQFGTVQITHAGNPASALIVSADFEIRPGDYVIPADDQPYDSVYVPHPPKAVPANMHVIAFTDALNSVGRLQVVALSFGGQDGVENGQVYSIFHANDKVYDDTDYPPNSAKRFFHHDEAKVNLPREYVGHVMVFRTFGHVSYGLIMDGIRPVHIDDKLFDPDYRG
jgi:LysM domain-containing protein